MSRGVVTGPAGVLLATDVFPPDCGGSGWSVHALARCLRDRGHRVEILEIDPQRRQRDRRTFDGFTVYRVGTRRQKSNPLRRLGAADYATERVRAAVAALLRQREELALVHAQHLHVGPGAVAAAREAGRAAVLTVRDYWPVCLHSTTWWGGSPCPACSGGALVGCMSTEYRWPRPLAAAMVPWARRRLAARARGVAAADVVVAVSEALRARLRRFGATWPMQVIPNIVDPAELERVGGPFEAVARQLDLDLPRRTYLLFVGKLTRQKGADALIDACAALEDPPPLVFAGSGPLEAELRRAAARTDLQAYFPGWLQRAHLVPVVRQALALVLPSRWGEPLARAMLEALALGTPVIAWPEDSSVEVLDEGGGFVVDGPSALARAVAVLMRPEERERLGAVAREVARARFAPEAVCPRWQRLYARVLARGRRGKR